MEESIHVRSLVLRDVWECHAYIYGDMRPLLPNASAELVSLQVEHAQGLKEPSTQPTDEEGDGKLTQAARARDQLRELILGGMHSVLGVVDSLLEQGAGETGAAGSLASSDSLRLDEAASRLVELCNLATAYSLSHESASKAGSSQSWQAGGGDDSVTSVYRTAERGLLRVAEVWELLGDQARKGDVASLRAHAANCALVVSSREAKRAREVRSYSEKATNTVQMSGSPQTAVKMRQAVARPAPSAVHQEEKARESSEVVGVSGMEAKSVASGEAGAAVKRAEVRNAAKRNEEEDQAREDGQKSVAAVAVVAASSQTEEPQNEQLLVVKKMLLDLLLGEWHALFPPSLSPLFRFAA